MEVDTLSTSEIRSAELVADGHGAPLTRDARVCALIPHRDSLRFLGDAIESLLHQSRPLDAIIVIDDASPESPVEVVEQYPTVTLLRSDAQVGPYALIQRAIERTDFEAYLFQDADDWSAPERLELLLAEAVRTGAELIGCQGLRVIVDEGEIVTYRHTLRPNKQLDDLPTANPVHHPTSLVSRDLVMRLGGFPTGLMFSGDTEFQRRAGFVARIANIKNFVYFYRTHTDSLTGSDETGHHTEIRRAVIDDLHDRAEENMARHLAGFPPRLEPMVLAEPATLSHLTGPKIETFALGGRSRKSAAGKSGSQAAKISRIERSKGDPTESKSAPVVVIGAPRSGASLLAGCISQHTAFHHVLDSTWIPAAATSMQILFDKSIQSQKPSDIKMYGVDVETFSAHVGGALRRLILSGPDVSLDSYDGESYAAGMNQQLHSSQLTRRRLVISDPALTFEAFSVYRLFPEVQFIHVLRNPAGVVSSLTGDNELLYRSHFEKHDAESAYQIWNRHVEAALEVEQAFGSERVLRVHREDLVLYPEETLLRTLTFLSESFEPAVLRPLR